MQPTTTLEKLKIMLPHWIEHNRNHEAEFKQWAAAARTDGEAKLADLLDRAAANMAATDEILQTARSQAGAPAGGGNVPHPHPHPHRHDHGTGTTS